MGTKPLAIDRLTLFIDAQNVYGGARDAFFLPSDRSTCGQFKPMELAKLICSRAPPSLPRQVHQVRVYTGRPDATKEPRTYAAHMRQCVAWLKEGAEIIARPLRYPPDWLHSKAQQKGVDVALAIDFVALAIDADYDVGVIVSTDSDLKPALEFVAQRFRERCRIEVAAWNSPRMNRRLSIAGRKIWCHYLSRDDYDSVADLTNYSIDN